jgi:hypothetical protein
MGAIFMKFGRAPTTDKKVTGPADAGDTMSGKPPCAVFDPIGF